jgi:hypothetical protein
MLRGRHSTAMAWPINVPILPPSLFFYLKLMNSCFAQTVGLSRFVWLWNCRSILKQETA